MYDKSSLLWLCRDLLFSWKSPFNIKILDRWNRRFRAAVYHPDCDSTEKFYFSFGVVQLLMEGAERILKVVAGAKILPLLGVVELGLKKLISVSSHSDLFCSFWLQ